MNDVVMLNVRMNRQTKERGCQVLERYGVSVSEFVRSVFEYLEKHQEIPAEFMQENDDNAAIQAKRLLLRSFSGCIEGSEPVDAKQMHEERLDEKFAGYLA